MPAGGRLLQGHLEQDGIPPADLVVAVVADHARIVAQRENLFARDLVHALNDFRVPHIPPGRPGRRADMQHRSERQVCGTAMSHGWKVAPSAYGGKAPGFEPFQIGFGPSIRVRVMLPGGVTGVGGIELLARRALVDATNAQRKEPLSVRPDQPGALAFLLN